MVKNLPADAGDVGNKGSIPLGQKDPLEEGTAVHSSILARRTPWTEETAGLQYMGVAKNRTGLKRLSMHARRKSTYTWESGVGAEVASLTPLSVT